MIEHSAAAGPPALDEESFTRLLAAAYVMQEHKDRLRANASPADLTQIISQVVETQHEIQSRSLEGDAAFALVAQRLCSVSGAAGVAIAIVNGNQLRYRGTAGSAKGLVGPQVAKHGSLVSLCLKTGAAFHSPLAQTDSRLDAAQCRKLGAQSVLAVPLYHDGQIAGAIEVYFSQVSAFGEMETRAAELMAGVASEVMAGIAEKELKEELESERASVLQALEMLEPELQKMAGQGVESEAVSNSKAELCRACGHAFIGNEGSCGVCGSLRTTGMYPGAALQSKWAVLWERHLTGAEQDGMPLFRRTPPKETVFERDKSPTDSVEKDVSEGPWQTGLEATPVLDSPLLEEEAGGEAATGSAIELSSWNSAAQAQEWLNVHHPETLWSAPLRVLRARPGDASLAVAALVLLITLVWAWRPRVDDASLANAHPTMATVKRRPRPKAPTLTLFERTLVGLGLAVPPPTPEYMGDPNIKVWEDLQTALYYCPDADLYGTTPKGRYTTQAEAQQEAFQPAFRKPCD